jgi:import inner membrane translocase subunit TIM10B
MDPGLSQFKDILTMYNHMSELCFNRCVINLNGRQLSDEEKACADLCAEKAMKFNNRLMKTFVVEQPLATERRLAEAQKDAEAAAERLKAQGADMEALTAQDVAREALLGEK